MKFLTSNQKAGSGEVVFFPQGLSETNKSVGGGAKLKGLREKRGLMEGTTSEMISSLIENLLYYNNQ